MNGYRPISFMLAWKCSKQPKPTSWVNFWNVKNHWEIPNMGCKLLLNYRPTDYSFTLLVDRTRWPRETEMILLASKKPSDSRTPFSLLFLIIRQRFTLRSFSSPMNLRSITHVLIISTNNIGTLQSIITSPSSRSSSAVSLLWLPFQSLLWQMLLLCIFSPHPPFQYSTSYLSLEVSSTRYWDFETVKLENMVSLSFFRAHLQALQFSEGQLTAFYANFFPYSV